MLSLPFSVYFFNIHPFINIDKSLFKDSNSKTAPVFTNKSNENTVQSGIIKINYSEIYKEVDYLLNFLDQEIINENNNKTNEFLDLLDHLNGKTNESIKENILSNKNTITVTTQNLYLILAYIKHSSHEMEKEDQLLA